MFGNLDSTNKCNSFLQERKRLADIVQGFFNPTKDEEAYERL